MGCGIGRQQNTIRQKPPQRIDTVDQIQVKASLFVTANTRKFQEVYRLGEVIGDGAFGEVRWCVRRDTGLKRAVKICRKDNFSNEAQKQKMISEIEILKNLNHPNIVKIFEYFEDAKRFFIVMELCNGGELFEQIVKRQNFYEMQAVQIMYQLFSVIAYLHENGIIHRDIKPENILLEDRHDLLNLKLIDFGTAVFQERDGRVKGAIGTAYYIAPEVLSGQAYDEKCDLWSCGVIMYVLLTGHAPFEGENEREIIDNVRKGQYDMTESIWLDVSREAKDLISNLLIPANRRLTAAQALNHP